MNITTCDTCNTGLAYDDWSALDYYNSPKEAEEAYSAILATVESVGEVVRAGDAKEPGYFNCYICNEIQCGGGHTWKGQE